MKENLYFSGIRTVSGNYINLMIPALPTIEPYDIAYALSRIQRWNGHLKINYSVAEHSLWCLALARQLFPNNKELRLRVLLHDAHEAYIGDIPKPVGDVLGEPLILLKGRLQQAIELKFGLPTASRQDEMAVKHIDALALQVEWEQFMTNDTTIDEYVSQDPGSVCRDFFNALNQLTEEHYEFPILEAVDLF